jgi:hypothetical protein
MGNLLITDLWWREATMNGHDYMNDKHYEKATTAFLRSLIHVEHMLGIRHDALSSSKSKVLFTTQTCFNTMYVCSCHNVASAFLARGENELAQHYLESAFCYIKNQIRKLGYYPKSDRCVDRLFKLCMQKLGNFLVGQGNSENEAIDYLNQLQPLKINNAH